MVARSQQIMRALGLLGGVATVPILTSLYTIPKNFALQACVISTVFSSAALVVFLAWENKFKLNVMEATSIQRIEVAIVLAISCYALFSIYHFVAQLPRVWWIRTAFVCGAICSFFVFNFCWSAVWAYVIRKMAWAPRACSLAGWPFAIVGAVFFFIDWFWNPNFPISRTVVPVDASLALFATATCRKLAFPNMEPRPDMFGRNWPFSIRTLKSD